MLIYSSGLRVSEVVELKSDDIIRDKMLLKIRQGKGAKDRYSILSETALKQLEKYWRAYKPATYFFPGKNKISPLSIRACQHAFEIAKKNAGITKNGGIHTLRHAFFGSRRWIIPTTEVFRSYADKNHSKVCTFIRGKYYCPKSS